MTMDLEDAYVTVRCCEFIVTLLLRISRGAVVHSVLDPLFRSFRGKYRGKYPECIRLATTALVEGRRKAPVA